MTHECINSIEHGKQDSQRSDAEALPERLGGDVGAKRDVGEVANRQISAVEYLTQPFKGYKRLPERYLQGEIAIEIDFRVAPRDLDGCLKEYIAVFQRLPRLELIALDGADITDWRDIQLRLSLLGVCNSHNVSQDDPMLVFIAQFGEEDQGIVAYGVPSSIRLREVDPSARCRMNPPHLPIPFLSPTVLRGGRLAQDRKGIAAPWPLSIGPDQLPNEMVEGGPDVLDEVSRDQAQFRGRGPVDLDAHDVARLLHVYLGEEGEGFFVTDVFPDLLIKGVEMGCRTV
jgi:hypothetical protein